MATNTPASPPRALLSNPLGDVRAEADETMLRSVFYETPDYHTLLTTDEKIVIVGRRGTGKSALTFKLREQWRSTSRNPIITITPEEHQTLALISALPKIEGSFITTRASFRLFWKYALLMETASHLSANYKIKPLVSKDRLISENIAAWGRTDQHFYDKLRSLVKKVLAQQSDNDNLIGDIADMLNISKIERSLGEIFKESNAKTRILVDRLDEGFILNDFGVAIMDGLITATIDAATTFRGYIRPLVFVRDNVLRAVSLADADYSRNIEAFTMRLHWDVPALLYLVTNRIRQAFNEKEVNSRRVWNRHVEHSLQDEEGFKRCLSMTLYRPRDILLLLNSAFESSARRLPDRWPPAIGEEDLEKSAREISKNRLEDLKREYEGVFPSVVLATEAFRGGEPESTPGEVSDLLAERVFNAQPSAARQMEDLAILNEPIDLIRALYSIGFLGIHDSGSGSFIFCHDGKQPDVNLEDNHQLLVHPCYWMALNLTRNNLDPDEAEQINDEYGIKVQSITPEIRKTKLGQLISQSFNIPLGQAGASDFEKWCLEALTIIFAGRLDDIDLHPNKNSVNRRDVVGVNRAESVFWQRIKDYGVRQIIFEAKNYKELTQDDYRQVLSYLSGPYGKLAFIVCRDEKHELSRDRELNWFKSMWSDHNVMIIKITAKFLSGIISKMRNPQRHDVGEGQFGSLLNTYERMYISQESNTATRSRRRRK